MKNRETHKRFELTPEWLTQDIEREARTLGLPEGSAEMIAQKVAEKVMAWAEKRAAMTMDDLNRKMATEIARYSTDLAYVYQNRGKII